MSATAEVMMPEVDWAADPMNDLEDRLAILSADGRRIAPVKWKGEKAWVVLQYKDVSTLIADEVNIPAAPEYRRNWDTQGAQPLKLMGAEHRASRTVLEQPFKIGEVRRRTESLLIPLADQLINEFGDRREVDLVAEYSRRYTFMVMAEILGIPVASDREEETKLINLVYALLQGGHIVGEDTPENRRKASLEAVRQMNEYLRPTIEARRDDPKEDMISFFWRTEEGGKPLSETVIYDYTRFLFPAGAETTHLSIGRMMNNVLSNEAVRDRLIANPQDRAAAVEETLRLTPAANLVPRTLDKDAVICDVEIPAGTTVLLSAASGMRDPTQYEKPNQFDIDQKRKPTLGFGGGIHFCLGSHLAKAEMLTSLNRLLDRLPGLRLSRPTPPAMGAVFRWVPELWVKFDDILPPK